MIENDTSEEIPETEEGRSASSDQEQTEQSAQSPVSRSEKHQDDVTMIMATHLGMDKVEIGELSYHFEMPYTFKMLSTFRMSEPLRWYGNLLRLSEPFEML